MDAERWRRIKEIFQRAVELPAQERPAYVDRVCGDDSELRAEVLSLLTTDQDATAFLEVSPVSTRASQPASGRPEFDDDRYRVVQRVGEGGMGEVFEAEQTEPVRRRVALKIIKRGMDTAEVIARFETERQALALMSHRAIARVFDAGATKQGRPYFVMEFVDGIPITDYCDRYRLTPRQRIKLFQEVCVGVQHAHQRGIIHRDLKPSNILVKIEGDEPVPKIIDFGVSKAVAQRLTERTLFTQLGQWVGTPEYMSPEQADPVALDVDTRTDVYSLGVVLYELLVGAKPFDPATLRRAGFDEVRRVIREDEPPRPSTRLTGLGEESTTAAKNRRIQPEALRRQLRGDLDAISMKALEKDRTRRYGSPTELANDLKRYLENEPVLATPPSAGYRLLKFGRRHRLATTAAILVLLAILAGSAVALWQAHEARQARARADRRFNEVRELANSFIFEVYDAIEELPGATPVRELVVRRALQYLDSLAQESAGDSELQRELAGAYRRIGDVQGAPFHANLGDTVGAAKSYREALRILTEETTISPRDPTLLAELAEMKVRLARMILTEGSIDDALRLFREAQEIGRKGLALEPGHSGLRGSLSSANEGVAFQLESRGDYPRAVELYRANLERDREDLAAEPESEEERRSVAIAHGRLASAVEGTEDWEGAAAELRRGIELLESVRRDNEHHAGVRRELAVFHRELARQLIELGQIEEAQRRLALSAASIAELRRQDPAEQVLIADLGVLHHVVGRLAARREQPAEACAEYERAFEVARMFVPEVLESVEVQEYLIEINLDYGEALAQLERDDEARDRYREAIRTGETAFSDDQPRVLGSQSLAQAYGRLAMALVDGDAESSACREAADLLSRAAPIRASLASKGSPIGWPDGETFARLEQTASSCR